MTIIKLHYDTVMLNNNIFAAFLSIMIEHINVNGKVDDALLCKELATYIHNTPDLGYYGETLWEFIYEYGEDEHTDYMGRDEYGEKQYYSHNPDTNWHARIRKELVAMGHYELMVTA